MKNLAYVLLIGMLFTLTTATAQKEETLFNRDGIRLTGIWWSPGVNVSQMKGSDDNLYFRSRFTGLEFNKSFLVGIGKYNLEGKVDVEGLENEFDMSYKGLTLGYAPKADKLIHPQFMLLVGNGKTYGDVTDNIYVVQPSAGIDVNVFRWLKIGVNGGYRFVGGVDTAGLSSNQLSAPYAELKFKIGYSWGRKNK